MEPLAEKGHHKEGKEHHDSPSNHDRLAAKPRKLGDAWKNGDDICQVDQKHSKTLRAADLLHDDTTIHDKSIYAHKLVHRADYDSHDCSHLESVAARSLLFDVCVGIRLLLNLNLGYSGVDVLRIYFTHHLSELRMLAGLLELVGRVVFKYYSH